MFTCFTIHSGPSRLTCKACSILCMACAVFTVDGTRQVTVATIYSMLTIQTCSTLYVTSVVFTGGGAWTVTLSAKNTGLFTSLIQLQ